MTISFSPRNGLWYGHATHDGADVMVVAPTILEVFEVILAILEVEVA